MADVAKKERTAAKGRFTRMNKSVNTSISKKLIKDTVDSRFQELEEAWKDLQAKHEKYVIAAEEDVDETYLDAPMNEFDETVGAREQYIQTLETEEATNAANDATQERANDLKRKQTEIASKKTKYEEACKAIEQIQQDEGGQNQHSVPAMNDAMTRMQASKTDIERLHEDMVKLMIADGNQI